MRRIENYFDAIPVVMQETAYKELLKTLLQKVARGETIKTAEDIQGYAPSEVKLKLEAIFDKKCAFCESNTKSGAHYDTEHFRPKGVYYWLAYEWSNFLLSCQRCNREYKLRHFPIENPIATAPLVDFDDLKSVELFYKNCFIEAEMLQNEGRLLLHPVLDDPKEHLEFLVNGEVIAKTRQGELSILHYGLNNSEKRLDLIVARKEVIKLIDNRVVRAVNRYKNGATQKVLYNDLLEIQTDLAIEINKTVNTEPYLSVLTACLKNFQPFFIQQFIGTPYEKVLKTILKRIDKALSYF